LGARIRIHPLLRDIVHGQEIVQVEGTTVGECLADLEKKYPGTEELIFEKKGKLLKQIEIFVNGEASSPNELAAPVCDGDELSILMLLSGG
jgi:molybdopterin converting factor small subunit